MKSLVRRVGRAAKASCKHPLKCRNRNASTRHVRGGMHSDLAEGVSAPTGIRPTPLSATDRPTTSRAGRTAEHDGTRFTNDGSGHGTFVSIDNVYWCLLVLNPEGHNATALH